MDKNDRSSIDAGSLVLGIDTGGTYTDGVLLEYRSRKVLAAHKSLTTKRDLSIGIEEVIDNINIEDASAVRMVSISTTLATNAIAEGKGKRVALLLIGYDPELIKTFDLADRFATPHYYFFAGGHDYFGREKEALDLPSLLAKVDELQDQVEAFAISSYFSPLNPEHEKRAFRAISDVSDRPTVLGHQLSTKLGSVERATTAALNASLLAILQEFIVAVRRALKRRQINAPLMVVRGDGTLMSDRFAARTPVETIHSGPAASAIGGRFLSKLDDALVVDIGGTTTDIALIRDGQVTVNEEGAKVGDYKTSVKAANILSIALGGDSHIALNRERLLAVGPERVVPLSFLAREFPQVRRQLQLLAQRGDGRGFAATPNWLEYWFQQRETRHAGPNSGPKTRRQQDLLDFLRHGPKPLPEILEHLALLTPNQIGANDLLRQEIIGKSGLTPTDLLHAEGRFTPWDSDAASLALEIFSQFLSQEEADVRRQVWQQMTAAIVQAILTFLSGKVMASRTWPQDHDMGRWFFENSLIPSHPQLETRIRLRPPIIGIGAPAGIFLKDVASALNTELILPDDYPVANAVGAVAGSVVATEEILIYPHLTAGGIDVIGYYVQASDGLEEFEELNEALARARHLGRERSMSAALRSGADNPHITIEERVDGLDTYRVQVKAIGNPRLAK